MRFVFSLVKNALRYYNNIDDCLKMWSKIILLWCVCNIEYLVLFHTCIVTEREYEMVSTDASEGEEEEDVKPEPAELQVKAEKHSPAKQTKQASLRSFFGR